MRPKIKGDTFYVPSPDGVYLLNNRGSFTIKGASAYRWIERLVPHLNGEHTLEELIEGLDIERQKMVRQIIEVLFAEGFLKDVTDDQPHTLSETEMQIYAPEIAFIDANRDSAAYRFERYRQSKVVLIGSGLTFTALVHAHLKSGVRQLTLLLTDECVNHPRRYYEYLDLFNERGTKQSIIEIVAPSWEDEAEVAAILRSFDVVIHVSDHPMLARAQLLHRLCFALQIPFIQAMVVDDYAWIGPLVQAGTRGCWECGWRRLQANQPQNFARYAFHDTPLDSVSDFLALPTAAIISNQLSFEMFTFLTGVTSPQAGSRLMSVDMETLHTQTHPFLPHPCCSVCQQPVASTAEMFLATVERLQQGELLEQETFSKRAVVFFGRRLGLLRSLDEQNFVQMPLNISQVVVSSPMLLNLPPISSVGAGTDFHTPRYRATLRGCELYAASVFDQRRLPQVSEQTRAKLVVQGRWLMNGEKYAESTGCTWAYNLHTAQIHLVPVELIYPVLYGLTPTHENSIGLASGQIWAEAISRGLLAYIREFTLKHMDRSGQPFPRLDLSTMPLDSEGERYLRMLTIIGKSLTVYDVTGSLHVPTFAFCLEDKTIAFCTRVDALEALKEGLKQVVQHYQSMTNMQPEYALPPVPELPVGLRGAHLIKPDYTSRQHWAADPTKLLQTLQEHGYTAFAALLDHDPELTRVHPYIVRIVVASSE